MERNFPDWSINTLLANRAYDDYVRAQYEQRIKQYESDIFNTKRSLRTSRQLVRNVKNLIRKIDEDLALLGYQTPVSFGDDEGTP